MNFISINIQTMGQRERNSSLVKMLLLLSLTPTILTAFTMKKCTELTELANCSCSYNGGWYDIKCLTANNTLNLRIFSQWADIEGFAELENGYHVILDCNHIDGSHYKLFPAIDIGDCFHMEIRKCQLTGGFLAHLINNLGIQNLKRLVIKNSYLEVNSSGLINLFEGFLQLEMLEMFGSNLQRLPARVFRNLRKLKKLNLSHNQLQKISSGVFKSATPEAGFNLEILNLHHNNLKQLPTSFLQNQHKLKQLDLSNNQVRNLRKAAFEGVTSLTTLNLSLNGIENLQPSVFSLLTNLSQIYLNKNHFQTLPAELFTANRKLTTVHLVNNRELLTSLPTAFLANLASLQEVHITCNTNGISHDKFDDTFKLSKLHLRPNEFQRVVRIRCGVRKIPGDLFANSSKFTSISLANNEFLTLPATLLRDQTALLALDLSSNKLQTLPDELFKNTTELNLLILSYNQLSEISARIFSTLVNLQWLYMDNNRLLTINPSAFRRTTNIIYVNMENNHLNFGDPMDGVDIPFHEFLSIPSPFHYLYKLQTLNLRKNAVQYLYRDWKYTMHYLKELDLSFNNITLLDYHDFGFHDKNGVFINMSHNQLRLLDFTSIEMYGQYLGATQYDTIDLNHNPIVCDCKLLPFVKYLNGGFPHLPHVKLNFITNDLRCENPVDGTVHLVRDVQPKALLCPINCTHCTLGCKCWERTFDSVLIVNCSNTNLTEVPELSSLQTFGLRSIELHIVNNKLIKLPTTSMPGYANVTQIYAAGNQLSEIAVDNLPENLTYLDLSRNSFKGLNASLLDFFNQSHPRLRLALAGNPWNCDCENLPLMQFVQTSFAKITDVGRVYCAVLKTQTMMQYLANNDVCQQDWINTLTMSITILGFLFAFITALYYRYEIEVKVWLYRYPSCWWLVNEAELDKDKHYDAFVSYSHKDVQFIGEYLVPQLENGPVPFKLCIHVRDFLVGACIPDQIIHAIENSRRTIVVLSQNFIDSVWARMEFRLAHQAALNERRTRVIVIIYDDIFDTDSLDDDLKAYLKMNVYLKWGDPWFWDKLRYAMPHPTKGTNRIK